MPVPKLQPEEKKRRALARGLRFRQKREALGLCVQCDEPRIPGRTECEAHAAGTQARARARYHRNRAAGNCGTCGEPAHGKSLCQKCLSATGKYGRGRKEKLRAAGLCVTCTSPAVPGKQACAACQAKYTERQRAKGFGVSVEELRRVEAVGKCAICGDTEDLHVDHCHATGRVRGLLCERHNLALGQFKDSVEHLLRAAEYLRSPPAFVLLSTPAPAQGEWSSTEAIPCRS